MIDNFMSKCIIMEGAQTTMTQPKDMSDLWLGCFVKTRRRDCMDGST